MFTRKLDIVKKMDIGFSPDAGVSGAVVLQDDSNTFLIFNAIKRNAAGEYEPAGIGVVEFELCQLTKFGYPNDEALGGHPLAKKGVRFYETYEVERSSWIAEKTEQNRVNFPNTAEDTRSRHFIFTFHDSTFECIAWGLKARLDGRPFAVIISELAARLSNT